jgi:sulfoxide reductase heme-binding subunit YedZ
VQLETKPWRAFRRAVDSDAMRGVLNTTSVILMAAAASTVCGFLIGIAAVGIAGNSMPLWLVARAAGISAYLLLTGVTLMGIMLSHNTRARHRPNPTRIRLHLSMVIFTFVFILLHIAVLAVDPYAKVGLAGALLPMGAANRPVEVTLGLLSLWSALISGASASMAGRGAGKYWLYLHRLASGAWILAWFHGVLTGVDTPALLGMYTLSGIAVVGVSLWRYLSREEAVVQAQRDRTAVVVERALVGVE